MANDSSYLSSKSLMFLALPFLIPFCCVQLGVVDKEDVVTLGICRFTLNIRYLIFSYFITSLLFTSVS